MKLLRKPSYSVVEGDCLEAMRRLSEASVDVVVTSPPYNLGIKYSCYEDRRSKRDYLDWCIQWVILIHRLLKENGSFFLNLGSSPRNPSLPFEVICEILSLGDFVLQNTFHWIKSISVKTKAGVEFSVGHFKPINSQRYVNDCHEYIFHLTPKGDTKIDRLAVGVPYADKSNVTRWGHTLGKDKRCRGNNWYIPYETVGHGGKNHPAAFPVELPRRCLMLHGTDRVAKVVDPFCGSGSVGVACRELNIPRFTGIELDSTYAAISRKRIVCL